MNARAPVEVHDRLERVLAHTGYLLKELRHTSRTGALSSDLAVIWWRHLGPMERLTLASTALMALDRGTAERLSEATLCDVRIGEPVPPFTALREEARGWAALSSPGELRAYLAACWNHISKAEQARFLSAVCPKRRVAA